MSDAFGELVDAAMDNAEANMLDRTLGRGNPVSQILRAEAAVEQFEAVVDMVDGDW